MWSAIQSVHKKNENAMLPHNFIRYYFNCLQLMLSGLKTKDGIKDGCQNIFSKILIALPYIYTVYIFELLLD